MHATAACGELGTDLVLDRGCGISGTFAVRTAGAWTPIFSSYDLARRWRGARRSRARRAGHLG